MKAQYRNEMVGNTFSQHCNDFAATFSCLILCVYFGCTRQQDVHLLAQIITDLLWSDEVISYLEIPGDYSDGKEPVMTINLTERFKIDHRALLWTNPTLRKSQFI